MEQDLPEERIPQMELPGSEMYDAKGVRNLGIGTDPNYRHKLVPVLAVTFALLHVSAVYGIWLVASGRAQTVTIVWALSLGMCSAIGILLGAHRGYSHNAFKMTPAAEIMFIILQTLSGQNHIYWWARDHRLHHKFCDTDADPYNSSRGFFFSHIGWLITRKHPLVAEKGRTIDMSDLEANKFIMFQRKYFTPMFLLFCVAIPTAVPIYLWNESLYNSLFISFAFRYITALNITWCLNSFAHLYGTRGFDKRVSARQSTFGDIISLGCEGWHNYHHTFPWDHAYSELGHTMGVTTKFLYLLQKFGLVYDLKTASKNLVYAHSQRYGDGTFFTGPNAWEKKS